METMGTEEIRSRLITITCAVFFLIAFFGHKGAVLAFTKIDTKRKLRQSLSLHSNEKESTWILLAEGEQSLRNKMGKYISNEGGHVVTGVADATSTILVCRGTVRPKEMQSIDNSTRYPDCLVLDAQLPGTINGLDLLKVIRTDESLKFLPVILFGESERANGYDGEPDAYLTKPFDLDELLSVIDSVTKTGRFTGRLMPNRAVEINNSVIKADELRQELSDIKSLLVKSGFNMTNIFNTTNDTNSHSIQKDLREIKQTVQNRYTQAKPTDVYRKKVCTEHVTNQDQVPQEAIKHQVFNSDEVIMMGLMDKGMTNKEIALTMKFTSDSTSKILKKMFKKATVENKTELLKWWRNQTNIIK